MDIVQLKSKIESNTLDDSLLILKYSDNKFLCNHYVQNISKNKKLNILNISSINEVSDQTSFFDIEDNYLYVLDVEKLTEFPDSSYKNLIIICKEVPENLTVDYIEIDKLINWQIEDYVKMRLQGLGDKEVCWLCDICKYDIYRLDQECKKLEIFPIGARSNIFNIINSDNGYCDLTDKNLFDFTDAVIKKDMNTINNLIPDIFTVDIEPLGAVTTLLKKFKQILAVQTNCKSVITSMGISDKQMWYLKNNQCNIYTTDQLIRNIEFLTDIDYNVKTGNLELSKESFLDYIVINILN